MSRWIDLAARADTSRRVDWLPVPIGLDRSIGSCAGTSRQVDWLPKLMFRQVDLVPKLICLDRFGHQSQCQDGSTWPPVLIHLDGSTRLDGSAWLPEPICLNSPLGHRSQ